MRALLDGHRAGFHLFFPTVRLQEVGSAGWDNLNRTARRVSRAIAIEQIKSAVADQSREDHAADQHPHVGADDAPDVAGGHAAAAGLSLMRMDGPGHRN